MSDDEMDEEIKQLELLDRKKRLYGTAMPRLLGEFVL